MNFRGPSQHIPGAVVELPADKNYYPNPVQGPPAPAAAGAMVILNNRIAHLHTDLVILADRLNNSGVLSTVIDVKGVPTCESNAGGSSRLCRDLLVAADGISDAIRIISDLTDRLEV